MEKHEARGRRKRLEQFKRHREAEVALLREKVDDLAERFERSRDELPALIEGTVYRVVRQPAEGRRVRLTRPFVRLMILEQEAELSEKLLLLREIGSLSDTDLAVLKVFQDGTGHELREVNWKEPGLGRAPGEGVEVPVGPVSELEARGLIMGTAAPSGVSMLGDDGIPKNWRSQWSVRRMWDLPLGLQLLRAVSHDG